MCLPKKKKKKIESKSLQGDPLSYPVLFEMIAQVDPLREGLSNVYLYLPIFKGKKKSPQGARSWSELRG